MMTVTQGHLLVCTLLKLDKLHIKLGHFYTSLSNLQTQLNLTT